MRKLKTAVTAAVLGIAAISSAVAAPITIQRAPLTGPVMQVPNIRAFVIHLDCKVWGTPVEFPSDVLLTNTGSIAVAAGTKIHWDVPAPHYQGSVMLAAPLAVGGHLFLNNVLAGGAVAGTPCTTSIVK